MRKLFLAFMALAAIALVGCKDKNEPKNGGEVNIDCSLPANAEAVDLGLPSGIKWANMNVGATKPEEYGAYFAWGETKTKDTYNWDTYCFCRESTWRDMTRYTYPDGQLSGRWYNGNTFVGDNRTVLEPGDDAATDNWGGKWRMPTKEEIDELCTNCTWTWTQKNGINGYEVKGSNGNSIFLPASGLFGGDPSPINVGISGYYWSSSLCLTNSSYACRVKFNSYKVEKNDSHVRGFGHAVRPVCK